MTGLLEHVKLTEVAQDVLRNVTSIRVSQDLFDDLSEDVADWALAQAVEHEVKPKHYRSATPVIHRPYEHADWVNAISYPFAHLQPSRYSDGSFGVWYGSADMATTVYETVYHWCHGLLADAGWLHLGQTISTERKVYRVRCDGALLDLRPLMRRHPELMHADDYRPAQTLGARLAREGHPGCLTPSVRHEDGVNFNILNPQVLSSPRAECYLTYHYRGWDVGVEVEKTLGQVWMRIRADAG